MAKQAASNVEDVKIVQLIVFHVGEEEFGVPIGEVREIIKAGAVTPVPDSPKFIRGLINVRGDIVATIDLRVRFSMRTRHGSEAKHTVITKQQDTLFGLMVDEVTEVLRIPETDIKKAPKLMTKLHDDYVTGVLPLDNRLIVLLDLARVLSEEDLIQLSKMNHGSGEPQEEGTNEFEGDEPDRNEPARKTSGTPGAPGARSGRRAGEYAVTAGLRPAEAATAAQAGEVST